MVRLLVLFILLLPCSVERGYSEKEILISGRIIDPSWWYRSVNTGQKGSQPAQGWVGDSIMFESSDPINGAWALTKPVDLPKNVTSYYVDIVTKKTACFNQTLTCSLQIFTYNETKELRIPGTEIEGSNDAKRKRQIYLLNNFKRLYNITFTDLDKIEMTSFKFTYNGSKIRFAIRARGIFGEFHNMTLYYYYCTEIVQNSVRLPRTIAPAYGSKSVTLHCTSNAVSKYNESSFEGSCWYNGTWSFPRNDTVCLCRPGYEMLEMGCERCQVNYYKLNISNKERCQLCPNGSILSTRKNAACECIGKRYRLKHELKVNSAPCYGFPSKVRDIKIERKGFGRIIILKWKHSTDDGGLPDSLKYDVDCTPHCHDQLTFTPNRISLTNTSVQISGLIPGHLYKFTVSSKNIISEQHANGSYASESKTYKVPDDNVGDKVASNTSNRITIIVTTVNAGLLLGIIFIVILAKLKRQNRPPRLLTPIDIPLETGETSPKSQLPIDSQEPYYEDVTIKQDVATNTETSAEGNTGYEESVNEEERDYETASQCETYEEPILLPHNPGYAELDGNQRRSSENDDYQKLQWPDSDYVIPAHERQESCEYVDMRGQDTELDQSKRETEESQRSTYQNLKLS